MSRATDRLRALHWAAEIVAAGNWVAFDSETTDLDGEIVSWAVCDPDGHVLGEGLVKPTVPISLAAQQLHGITDAMLIHAPTFAEAWPEILALVTGKLVVIYNALFEMERLRTSAREHALALPFLAVDCAMLAYAQFHGEWNSYHQDYRWKSLAVACERLGIKHDGAHTAAGDAKACAAIVQAMARLAKSVSELPEEVQAPVVEKVGVELFDREKGEEVDF